MHRKTGSKIDHRTYVALVIAILIGLAATPMWGASITIPAGTTVTVRLADSIESGKNYAGQTFHATVDSPVAVDGRTVVPQGAQAIGRVTSVSQAGRFRGRSVVLLELTALNFDGRSFPVLTSSHQESGSSRGKQTAMYAGGGGLAGTIVGTIAAGPAGFLLGSTLGAAGGVVVQAVRGAAPLRIPAETLILFTVQSPVAVEAAY